MVSIHPVRSFPKGFSFGIKGVLSQDPKRELLSNGAGLKRNPAPSRTDGLLRNHPDILPNGNGKGNPDRSKKA
jgi:hypothetical protein